MGSSPRRKRPGASLRNTGTMVPHPSFIHLRMSGEGKMLLMRKVSLYLGSAVKAAGLLVMLKPEKICTPLSSSARLASACWMSSGTEVLPWKKTASPLCMTFTASSALTYFIFDEFFE